MKTMLCQIQDKYKGICLGLSQAKTSQAIQCTCVQHCINKLLKTSSAVLCTHTVQLHCFPFGNSFSSQAGLSPRTWERTVDPLPYSGVERALRPSVPSIPLLREFPCLVWHREGTLSRVWSRFQARAAWKLCTDWLAGLTYITIQNAKRKLSFNPIIVKCGL